MEMKKLKDDFKQKFKELQAVKSKSPQTEGEVEAKTQELSEVSAKIVEKATNR